MKISLLSAEVIILCALCAIGTDESQVHVSQPPSLHHAVHCTANEKYFDTHPFLENYTAANFCGIKAVSVAKKILVKAALHRQFLRQSFSYHKLKSLFSKYLDLKQLHAAVLLHCQNNCAHLVFDTPCDVWLAKRLAMVMADVAMMDSRYNPRQVSAVATALYSAVTDGNDATFIEAATFANAVANGVPYQAALAAVTSVPAEIFGLEDLGKLEPGKVADIVLWDGDPLEVMSAPAAIYIDGEEQSLTSRQTELRDRYLGISTAKKPPAYLPETP